MSTRIAKLAAQLEKEPEGGRRAVLEELAVGLLQLDILRSQSAGLRAYACLLDGRGKGGEDDERDGAAA